MKKNPEIIFSIQDECFNIRAMISSLEKNIYDLLDHKCFDEIDRTLEAPNIPKSMHANMRSNITLAFRHLEDARMRLGKVVQAYEGGVSIFDKTV